VRLSEKEDRKQKMEGKGKKRLEEGRRKRKCILPSK
jgi:hypothetical protein